MEVNITVSTFAGIICELGASLDWTVRRVRDEIEKSSGIPVVDQRLFLKTGQLVTEDFQRLREVLPPQNFFGPAADFAFKCGPKGGLTTSLDIVLMQREPEASAILKVLQSGSKDTVKQMLSHGKLEAIKQDPELLKLAYEISPDALRFATKEFALEEVIKHPTKLKYVSEDLRSDKDVVLAALESGGSQAWPYISPELKNERSVILKLVAQDGGQLKYLSNQWRADRDVVLGAIQSAGFALQFAAEALRNDRTIALLAVSKTACAIQHIGSQLLADRTFWMAVLEQNGEALKYGSDEIKNDKELVSLAVQQNGCSLRYASDPLREDIDVVAKAVDQHPYALNYAAETVRRKSSTPRHEEKRQRITHCMDSA